MPRQKFPSLIGGLSTKTSSLVGNLGTAQESYDSILTHDILEQRFGHRVLDEEPSFTNNSGGTTKTRARLTFDGTGDKAVDTSWVQTLGTKWTLRWEVDWAISGNDTNGTRCLLEINQATVTIPQLFPLKVEIVGVTSGNTIAVQVSVADLVGKTCTITSTARTVAAWQALYGTSGHRYLTIVRDGATVTAYLGWTSIGSATIAGSISLDQTVLPSEPTTSLYIGQDSAGLNDCKLVVYSNLVIINRVLTEAETYFGIGWPTDKDAESDILGNWPFNETTGTTLTDYSKNGNNLTITNATWSGTSVVSARGLGVFTHRLRNGTRYYAVASGRCGTSSAAAGPTGVIYIWTATQAFTPFYFAGDSGNDDASATITGLDYLSRIQFLSVGDLLYMGNGVDYARKYGGSTPSAKYWGITAPATAPVVTLAGSGGAMSAGNYSYCYTYYNPVTGTESGRSPVTTVTAVNNDSAALLLFFSSDPQVTHIRVYRTQVNGTTFTLLLQAEVANATNATYADTYADTKIVGTLALPGADAGGNGRVKRLYLQGGPATACDAAVAAGGAVDAGVHYYAYSWYNPTTGAETGMSPAVSATTAGGNLTVNLGGVTPMDLPDQNTGYTQQRIYRTKKDVREWYLLATQTAGATYSDAAADSTLSTTIETRALPPKCKYGVVFANRLILFGDTANPSTMYVSTAGDHENFPWINSHVANAGAEITAGSVMGDTLFYLHHNDQRIYGMPHPGSATDINLFLVLNMREVSPKGAAVSHWSIQTTQAGTIWLARDRFVMLRGNSIEDASPTISVDFLNLNRIRAKYACSLYMEDENLYICWLSRGNNRLNEEAFVYDFQKGTWTVWRTHADAAGVLTDANEEPHYCFLVENGVLMELDSSLTADGDGSGTLSGAVAGPGVCRFTDISNRTAPTGGDAGYALWFVKSDGTSAQRFKLSPSLDIDGETFYPSYSPLLSGSWTVYFHGIRLQWKSMFTQFGDSRPDKTFQSAYIYHGKESAGAVILNVATDESSFAAAHGVSFNLNEDMTSQVALQNAGRCLALELIHSPPAASQPVRLVEIEVEGDMAGDTP